MPIIYNFWHILFLFSPQERSAAYFSPSKYFTRHTVETGDQISSVPVTAYDNSSSRNHKIGHFCASVARKWRIKNNMKS